MSQLSLFRHHHSRKPLLPFRKLKHQDTLDTIDKRVATTIVVIKFRFCNESFTLIAGREAYLFLHLQKTMDTGGGFSETPTTDSAPLTNDRDVEKGFF